MHEKNLSLDIFFGEKAEVKKPPERKEAQRLYKLPKGWKWVRLKSLLSKKPQYGLTAKSRKEGRILYLRITDIDLSGKLVLTEPRYVDVNEETFNKYSIKVGDILIARSGATAGKAFLCEENMKAVFASYLIRFKVDERKILPKYLFYFLHSNEYWNQVKSWKVGGAQPNVNAQNLEKLFVPLAPIEEQKRIVSRIEELMPKIEEVRRLRKSAKKEAEKIMQAALHKVFTRAEEEWGLIRLTKICKINPSKSEIKRLPDDLPVTFVPMTAVSEISGRIEKPEVRLLGEVRKGYTYFRENDVLFAKITPCMENGKSAIARNLINGLGFGSTEFHVLRPLGEVLPEWVFYYIRQESFRDYAARHMTGSVGQKRVPVQFLKNVKIPFPPIEEQKKMVDYLNKVEEIVGSLRKLQQNIDEELERLVPAILDKAFKGEL